MRNYVLLLLFSILIGLFATLLFVFYPATVQNLYSRTPEQEQTLINIDPPGYLGELTPPFSDAIYFKPFGKHISNFHPDFGVEIISYRFVDTEREQWEEGTLPPYVSITRHLIGWPFRSMYWDAVGFSPDGSRPMFDAFSAQVFPLAGSRTGFSTPDWWPISNMNWGMPRRALWGGFLANWLIFGVFFYGLIFTITRLLKTIRVGRRLKSGVCVKCRYPVEGLVVCPECGVEVAGSF